jgi:hypothetical protein
MSCPIQSEEHADQLLAFTAGKLRGDAAAKLEMHMRSCAECEAVGKAQASVWNLLDAWEVPPVSSEFNRNLYARIDASASASWLERFGAAVNEFFQPVFARPAFALAAATLVIATGFFLDHPGRYVSPKNNRVSLQASSKGMSKSYLNNVEVDQVESTLEDIEMLSQFDPRQSDTGKDTTSKSM